VYRRLLKATALVICGALIGALIGFTYGTRYGRMVREVGQMAALGWAGTSADMAYRLGDYALAKDSLTAFLVRLRESDRAGEFPELFDQALTLTRLSLLEERHGDSKQSQTYMNEAVSIMRAVGSTSMNREKLRSFVGRLDSERKTTSPPCDDLTPSASL